MNTMTRAHQIRKTAAVKFGCKVSEIHFGECLRLAHEEKIEMTKVINMTSNQGQKFSFLVSEGTIIEATVETARGILPILNPAMTSSGKVFLSGRVTDPQGRKKRVIVEFDSTAVRDELAKTKPREIKPEEVISGLAELKAKVATYSQEDARAARVMESGSSAFAKRTVTIADIDALKLKYQAAAEYMRACSYRQASNDKKMAAGIKAAKMLMNGSSAAEAADVMDNWV